ncbi:metallophosphoesterase family protein [Sphingobacterium paludis]|uniref:Calcineurin-like phosphoesterase family protein n=1 Tax=Sphingobacterium paludis TaxID=1476465 RepID=A0A4R7D4Y4_9SPHI|nr:metallophosphoesterase [Sphingobacterium paludis]TDS16149.1 calcineurin-like phosphoesterase family protein [Sphingobacterium paludis]
MRPSRSLPLLAACFMLLLLSACKRNFQYSVLEVKTLANDLNKQAIDRLSSTLQRDTFSFLVIADTQIAYDELEAFVKHANQIPQDSIAFVLHGGDFTDYGANFEYNLYYDDIKKLKFPVIGTIGNHDMLGNGREIFRQYFGPEDFTFHYGNTAFIVFNSNSREVAFDGNVPNVDWLRAETEKARENKNIIYLSHIAPISFDFDQTKTQAMAQLLSTSANARLSIHGHSHSFDYRAFFDDGFPYLVAPTLLKRSYVKVNVADSIVTVEELFY